MLRLRAPMSASHHQRIAHHPVASPSYAPCRRRVQAVALDAAVLGAVLDTLLGVHAALAAEAADVGVVAPTPFDGVNLELLSFGLTAAVAVGAPLAFAAARNSGCVPQAPAWNCWLTPSPHR